MFSFLRDHGGTCLLVCLPLSWLGDAEIFSLQNPVYHLCQLQQKSCALQCRLRFSSLPNPPLLLNCVLDRRIPDKVAHTYCCRRLTQVMLRQASHHEQLQSFLSSWSSSVRCFLYHTQLDAFFTSIIHRLPLLLGTCM